jgi:hypothetical protein
VAAPAPEEEDPLLDRFLPVYEIVERHQIRVAAPAAVTLDAARDVDLQASPVVRTIIRAREIILGATPVDRRSPRGLLAETQSLGWGVLADVAGREVVVGAVTTALGSERHIPCAAAGPVRGIQRTWVREDRMDHSRVPDHANGINLPDGNASCCHRPERADQVPSLLVLAVARHHCHPVGTPRPVKKEAERRARECSYDVVPGRALRRCKLRAALTRLSYEFSEPLMTAPSISPPRAPERR